MSFLEVNRSGLENKLLLNADENTDVMNSLLSINNSSNVPVKMITPIPGLCIKTFTKTGDKIFINLCHTDEIPQPKKSTIPMSIGNEKEVTDKEGNLSVAFDVALNSSFFKNNQNEIVILTIIDALADKHGLQLQPNNYRILKNIKSKGKISPMNIEQRPVKPDPQGNPLITEIEPEKETKVPAADSEGFIAPDFNLIKVNTTKKFYACEVDLKNITSKNNISLQVGKDRVFLVTNGNVKYEVDFHFPEIVDNELCKAEFNSVDQILTIIVPIMN